MEHKPTDPSPFAPSPEAAEEHQPHQIHFTPVPHSQPPSAATPAQRAAGAARRAGESRPTGGKADRIDVTAARDTSPLPRVTPKSSTASQFYFTPVPRQRARRNGWTPQRQRLFIAALAGCGSVTRAARAVGMTSRSAYRLMDAPGADSFAAAWDAAIDSGIERVRADALERAIHGAPVALFRRGKLVRVEQQRNDRLAIALLGGRPATSTDLPPHGGRPARPLSGAPGVRCRQGRGRRRHDRGRTPLRRDRRRASGALPRDRRRSPPRQAPPHPRRRTPHPAGLGYQAVEKRTPEQREELARAGQPARSDKEAPTSTIGTRVHDSRDHKRCTMR